MAVGDMIPHHTAVKRLREAGYTVTAFENSRGNRVAGIKLAKDGMLETTLHVNCFSYCELDVLLAEKKIADFEPLTSEGR